MIISFFFNDSATTEIYTLSLHDALPISLAFCVENLNAEDRFEIVRFSTESEPLFDKLVDANAENRKRAADFIAGLKPDRKSTRLNSSHANISYAVFCLKKKIKQQKTDHK